MMRKFGFLGVVLLASTVSSVSASLHAYNAAFASPQQVVQTKPSIYHHRPPSPSFVAAVKRAPTTPLPTTTSLQMYNLPPSGGGGGGGGGGPLNDLKQILPGVLTVIGLVAFFASPLGGIFFAITNSLLLISFLTPVILLVGFQLWQTFNTISGPCPNCSAPVRVLKNDDGQPSICLNCGSFVRADVDKNGIELCNSPDDVMNSGAGGLFSDLFGGGGMFDTQDVQDVSSTTTTNTREQKQKRERTIIDVDVEDA
eukprot:CAMPEP_0185740240 /NCGR_PEP_ID=MMETSP1171-20130828/37346_1 /TAXON_ID=374046 /ORGANISM="Helicotheca tamensis, Strain CCMP826" /LENGTH=254 /DNA_ID=CAMNT_0028412039 /DNA_START=130 /DNA_END=894 /DNA_ORIENTATION=+